MNGYRTCLFLAYLMFSVISLIKGENHECNGDQCIPVRNCESVINVLKQIRPLTSEQRNYLRTLKCGFEGSTPKVCCPREVKFNLTTSTTDQVTSDLLPNRDICGLQIEDRIIGGEEISFDQFTWMALLKYKNGTKYAFRCGGVLINNRYVLTAAHCVKNTRHEWELVSVRLGENIINEDRDCESFRGIEECADPPLDINIEKQIVHELYDLGLPNHSHDIGLLRLSQAVPFSDFVRPICLPNLLNGALSTNGSVAVTVGWGIDEDGVQYNTKLKNRVTILSSRECSSSYREKLGMALSENQMCIQRAAEDKPCRGDIGGPLMVYNVDKSNYWMNLVIIGIESFGAGCEDKSYPKVYTNVSTYNEWVINNVKP